jgi:hypothetical protein
MAASKKTLTHEPDGSAMTLDELAAFVQDAMRSGASGSESPKVRITFGGGIKRIELGISERAVEDADR